MAAWKRRIQCILDGNVLPYSYKIPHFDQTALQWYSMTSYARRHFIFAVQSYAELHQQFVWHGFVPYTSVWRHVGQL